MFSVFAFSGVYLGLNCFEIVVVCLSFNRTFLRHAVEVVYMLESRHVSVILLGKKFFKHIYDGYENYEYMKEIFYSKVNPNVIPNPYQVGYKTLLRFF